MKKQYVKVNLYRVISDQVENGIEYGWSRAHKHTNKPDEDLIRSAIYDAVMLYIAEYIDFGEDYE